MSSLVACLIVSVALVATASSQALPQPSAASLDAVCQFLALQNPNGGCGVQDMTPPANLQLSALCAPNPATGNCTFISGACPAGLQTAMLAVSQCGASAADACPASCTQPDVALISTVYTDAGLTTYTGPSDLQNTAGDKKLAQAVADFLYCQTTLTAEQYNSFLAENCTLSAAQYNAGIQALMASNGTGSTGTAKSAAAPVGMSAAATFGIVAVLAGACL
ncbi:Uncharacterized protein PBTT_09139 [Plasmodiophora brassicae]